MSLGRLDLIKPLGPTLPERWLLFRDSVVWKAPRPSGPFAVGPRTLAWVSRGLGEGVVWELLGLLASTPVYFVEDPRVGLRRRALLRWDGGWSIEQNLEATRMYLDADRLRRCLQLLGMLTWSRREEFR